MHSTRVPRAVLPGLCHPPCSDPVPGMAAPVQELGIPPVPNPGALAVVAPFHAQPPAGKAAVICCSFFCSSAFPWPLHVPCISPLSGRAPLAAPAQ